MIRRRPALAVAAVGSIVGTAVATQLLKNGILQRPLLVEAESRYTGGSFPSGHTAAVAAIVLALAMVVPGRGRTAVLIIGAAVVVLVGNLTMAAWLTSLAPVGRVARPRARTVVDRLLMVCAGAIAVLLVALAVQRIQYYPHNAKDLTAFVLVQLLAAATSIFAVVGFARAWRGLEVVASDESRDQQH
ncbi:hypothetical protein C5C66_02850 [Rathayibacter toxicus]|uniref:Uncharacterized protein n=2 Tax=Rathayibacter toxicus TaxID=145458 RepID=A0A2S5Y8V6_9MICO|nr:hypothetical protein APU90_03435 [Rathayibacter toxicus]PPG23191.1 hypothetical protein C5D15_02825 [Rathayibacter toxicus]PPG47775.1 hypothetical protein C5D16_02820 [Rathayibacter toxicus]PPH24919.1 hypothetical protein C5D17_02805 [Rathayibacter toxicus]PPH60839.1 hypothetical protein C5C93_02855 [Rathayibacter toxicus]